MSDKNFNTPTVKLIAKHPRVVFLANFARRPLWIRVLDIQGALNQCYQERAQIFLEFHQLYAVTEESRQVCASLAGHYRAASNANKLWLSKWFTTSSRHSTVSVKALLRLKVASNFTDVSVPTNFGIRVMTIRHSAHGTPLGKQPAGSGPSTLPGLQ